MAVASTAGVAALAPAAADAATSCSSVTTPTLLRGCSLYDNQFILSAPEENYNLLMRPDGNLVEYRARACWSSRTSGAGNYATYTQLGSLVVYNNRGVPLWSSNTNGGGTTVSINDLGGALYVGTTKIFGGSCAPGNPV
ncbi:hypothetical protein QRX50_26515 [Amycolatopsis carbonis]|uniref:Bulb-type lectin domain-containing protein n=1 Tax=Amycolatopsis carbonis TaxID=715471 RepID=A0A9Y2I863_9PSEU|nr:hypothetical protein [Amycolatopsis sp. 2-15]WIX75104.1 hypothetical protein QRX50_26515 [Amycolatopsis sp. 2-15]